MRLRCNLLMKWWDRDCIFSVEKVQLENREEVDSGLAFLLT